MATGTLTLGQLAFREAVDAAGIFVVARPSARTRQYGECHASRRRARGAEALDAALRAGPESRSVDVSTFRYAGSVPFDHDRRLVSSLGDAGDAGRNIARVQCRIAIASYSAEASAVLIRERW